MSRLENMKELEKQLAELQMANDLRSPGRVKKIPPAVPPKKKAQPQVPHSSTVGVTHEPSYASKIPVGAGNNNPVYSNMPSNNIVQTDYSGLNLRGRQAPSNNIMPLVSNQSHVYSNVSAYGQEDVIPPPPPPPPLHVPPPQHFLDSNHNNEDFLPPPSPVSSNYSELMIATKNSNYHQGRQGFQQSHYQPEYPTYGGSQTSTYESFYEPINPRPHSAMSTPPNSGIFQPYQNGSKNPPCPPMQKEEEVDALTNLLVKSISNSQEADVYGVCVRCGENVIGEASGCTAMGNMYHVECFTCHRCNTNLQGKPFYAVEGQPYCEPDYLETLEKCSVCEEPILDRILRATGKPYHPACFTCVVCGKSLDGIPFTVDAMNLIHCIEDFHKKFAPRCCVCSLPIMPEDGQEETVRVVALDRSFHVRCYRCEDCGTLLSSEAEGRGCYPLDDHILCKGCNAHRVRMLTNVMTTDL